MSARDVALSSLARLYGRVTRMRNWGFEQGPARAYRSSLPVVSIGNITAGGNGKTPLCILLAEELLARGRKPVILSRGYGGTHAGPHVVQALDAPALVGDEPALMARHLKSPVVIARRRAKGARLIEQHKLGDLIVLDDGFQHRALARSLDIVCINASSDDSVQAFAAGKLLPEGRFREDRDRALTRAHVVVLSKRSLRSGPAIDCTPIERLLPAHIKVFSSTVEPLDVVSIVDGQSLATREVVAFSGIANPEGFFATLQELGFNVLAKRPFRDHHPFSLKDIEALRTEFPHRALVCTEKDAVKLKGAGHKEVFSLATKTVLNDLEGLLKLIAI